MTSLRARNRRNTLAVTQRAAVELFAKRGFDDVKVTDIAAEVGMAPSTVYRHFPSKESLVLWEEHEQHYEAALASELGQQTPFEALRKVCVKDIAQHYDDDADFQLLRVRLIYDNPSIYAAAAEKDRHDRHELSRYLEQHLKRKRRQAAIHLAAATFLAMDLALEQWRVLEAKKPLTKLVERSFDALSHLANLG